MIERSRYLIGRIDPFDPLTCGQLVSLTLRLAVQAPIQPGGRMRLYFTESPFYRRPPLFGLPVKGYVFFVRVHFQTQNPQDLGFLTATAASDQPLNIEVPPNQCFLDVICTCGLPKNDQVDIVIGDQTHGSPGIEVVYHPTFGPWQMLCDLDAQGDGRFTRQDQMPRLKVVTAPPVRVLVRTRSHVQPGTPLDLHVAVVDRYGNHVEEDQGTIAIHTEGQLPETVQTHKFDTGLNGTGYFPDSIALQREGVHRVRVQVIDSSGQSLEAISNPVSCQPQTDGYKLFWGETHGHSYYSDGTHSPQFYYNYGRTVGQLDFCALTDHNCFDADLWADLVVACDAAYDAGRYTTFLGYEWTGDGLQSIVVYFKKPSAGVYLVEQRTGQQPSELMASLADLEVLAARHDMPPLNTEWASVDDSGRIERLVEIYSTFHTSESPEAPNSWGSLDSRNCIQSALANGLRFGFLGGSDTHLSMPGRGLGVTNGYPGNKARAYGLTAVYSPANTREDIFAALQARRCYAATDRILLDFRLNGEYMGGEVPLSSPPIVHVRAAGTAPFMQVDLIRNNRVIHQTGNGAWEIEFEFKDHEKVHPGDFYYVRVVQQDGGMAWASPIWLE